MRILAIDQGTTSTRAILFQRGAEPRLLLTRTHAQRYPRPGWVEHDPEELLADIRACLEAGAAAGAEAVGLANQGESCLAWEAETGRPVSPVIVWQDDRTAQTAARLKAEGAETLTLARAGLPLDPYFSASKLGWILREIPEAAALARAGRLRLGTTDAFFRDRLTGRFETDPTTASRTALLDLDRRVWDPDLCALFGVPIEALPSIAPTAGDLGALASGGPALTASLVDQQAALYGHGCRAPGAAKITFGTGAFALAATGAARPEAPAGLLPTIAWAVADAPPVYALEGGVYTASAAVNWARGLGLFSDFAEISAFDGPPACETGLFFVPALAGLACPHWDRAARGAWLGLSLETGRREMLRALLEGVAFRAAEVVAAIDSAAPLSGPVSIDGGLSRNGYFAQMLADSLARPVRVSADAELTAAGVAGLAALGAGGAPPGGGAEGRLVEPRPFPDALRKRFAAAVAAARAFGGA
jgi:glycerol kinase